MHNKETERMRREPGAKHWDRDTDIRKKLYQDRAYVYKREEGNRSRGGRVEPQRRNWIGGKSRKEQKKRGRRKATEAEGEEGSPLVGIGKKARAGKIIRSEEEGKQQKQRRKKGGLSVVQVIKREQERYDEERRN